MPASVLKRDLKNLIQRNASLNFQAQNGLLSLRSWWRSVRSLPILEPNHSRLGVTGDLLYRHLWITVNQYTAIPGRQFFLGKDTCFDLPFRRSLVHNASLNSPSYHLGQGSGSPWHLLPVKHGRISLPTPSSKFSAPISALIPTTARARSKSPCTTP